MTVDVRQLSLAERIELVKDLWDSITETPDALPITDAQRAELDRRLAVYAADPRAGQPWAVVTTALRAQAPQ